MCQSDPTEGWSAYIQQEIMGFLRQFQSIGIVVAQKGDGQALTVPVHAPYMMQSTTLIDSGESFQQLAQRHQDRLLRVREARDRAPAEVRAFLRRCFYGDGSTERWVAQGRAEPEEIRTLLQAVVDQGLVPAAEARPHPHAQDLRKWLKEYGIGVDCSAFVQQALTRVVEACHAAAGARGARLHADAVVGWMTSKAVYRELTADPQEAQRFERVPTPAEARPGDVLVRSGHIRIVAATEPATGGAVILKLAESTSAADIPSGQADEEADIGPRLIPVTYPAPECPIQEQTPLTRRLNDDEFRAATEEREYVLGRLRTLGRLCRDHPVPEATTASGKEMAARQGCS